MDSSRPGIPVNSLRVGSMLSTLTPIETLVAIAARIFSRLCCPMIRVCMSCLWFGMDKVKLVFWAFKSTFTPM